MFTKSPVHRTVLWSRCGLRYVVIYHTNRDVISWSNFYFPFACNLRKIYSSFFMIGLWKLGKKTGVKFCGQIYIFFLLVIYEEYTHLFSWLVYGNWAKTFLQKSFSSHVCRVTYLLLCILEIWLSVLWQIWITHWRAIQLLAPSL